MHFNSRMIHLGDVDAVKCSSAYMRSVEILVKDMKLRFPDVPWVINTMGFCKGKDSPKKVKGI